ncbi:hypothetical protein [Gordonia insulae]|uniref:Uncharacterized protein n=1 Tax=Gordonia insulae TaxID=2420509 RepID=A0A3G8JED7_9ACTN|nr:hypothetical protein [Gordonia insulae]AZG43447.1 hypothetical protein D7316_00011 [Gordonia insulae]
MDEFLTIATTVQRKTGQGSFGATYATPTTEHGRVRYGAKLIRNSDGEQIVSQAHITYPLNTPTIPVDSIVTVPSHSALERRVIAEERHDTGMADMPNHYTIDLD